MLIVIQPFELHICNISYFQVENYFHHVDPSHDLDLKFHMQGFKASPVKFPRAEVFSTMAKYSGTKLSVIETMTFDPMISDCGIYFLTRFFN